MTGEVIDADEALRIGLVNCVVPHDKLNEKMMEMARQLVSGHTMAIRSTKKAVNLYIRWMLNQVFDYSCAMEYQCAMDVFKK